MKIQKISKTGSKYRITLDNGEIIDTYDDVILENRLLFDKTVDRDIIEKITKDTVYYDIYKKVLNLINRRLRSEKEVWDYLNKTEILDEDKEKIIYNLKIIGYVNDYNFARAYTNDKMNLTMDGPYKIARELEEHNIDSCVVNQMIESYPKELIDEHIVKIITKRVKANKRYTGYALKHRIISYLSKLGYSRSDIDEHLDIVEYDTALLEREMERFYKKYRQKFEGEELYLKLKSKLMERGFRSSDVNSYLKKKQF